MKWNLREKLEAARSEDRAAHGLPSDEASPWMLDTGTPDPRPTVAPGPASPANEGLPVWTGARTGITALVADAPLPERKPQPEATVISLVRDGDRCRGCGGLVRTDVVDLVAGTTHLSCRDCGMRYHTSA